LFSPEELNIHIRGCVENNRDSQRKLYNAFYGYAMSICSCHTNNDEDAVEILNDGFLKVFTQIKNFTPSYSNEMNSFKGWLRKIMVYTAIDHFRKNQKHAGGTELDPAMSIVSNVSAVDKLSYDEIIRFIQKLPPAYRMAVNLFIVEGLSHEEISQHLHISVGTSKSNLNKARKLLQKILYHENKVIPLQNVG
jgi:RNA polymerase sigma factor (sigma-70 family)